MRKAGPLRDDREGAPGEAGFTLLELMIALTILALSMTVVTAGVARRSPVFEVRATASDIAALMRDARVSAQASSQPVSVDFRVDERLFEGPGGQRVLLPEGVEADMESSSAAGRPAVIFLPDGSSTGGAILLRGPASAERVDVDWLTSRISRERLNER